MVAQTNDRVIAQWRRLVALIRR